MITAPLFDGRVHTHDDALDLLKYVVPGATVEVHRLPMRSMYQKNTERSRGYSIAVHRGGQPTVCVQGSYSLPAPAQQLAQHALDQVRKATGE